MIIDTNITLQVGVHIDSEDTTFSDNLKAAYILAPEDTKKRFLDCAIQMVTKALTDDDEQNETVSITGEVNSFILK